MQMWCCVCVCGDTEDEAPWVPQRDKMTDIRYTHAFSFNLFKGTCCFRLEEGKTKKGGGRVTERAWPAHTQSTHTNVFILHTDLETIRRCTDTLKKSVGEQEWKTTEKEELAPPPFFFSFAVCLLAPVQLFVLSFRPATTPSPHLPSPSSLPARSISRERILAVAQSHKHLKADLN